MAIKRVRRSQRILSGEEKARMRSLRQEVKTEKEDILRLGRQVFAEYEQVLAQTVGDLKRARQSQGFRWGGRLNVECRARNVEGRSKRSGGGV